MVAKRWRKSKQQARIGQSAKNVRAINLHSRLSQKLELDNINVYGEEEGVMTSLRMSQISFRLGKHRASVEWEYATS